MVDAASLADAGLPVDEALRVVRLVASAVVVDSTVAQAEDSMVEAVVASTAVADMAAEDTGNPDPQLSNLVGKDERLAAHSAGRFFFAEPAISC